MDEVRKFKILLKEISLIQTRFDKSDDLIYRGRKWFITLWVAIVGFSFNIAGNGNNFQANTYLLVIASSVSVLFYLYESGIRYSYYKFVDRYRTIRDKLNGDFNFDKYHPNDLSNHYRRINMTRCQGYRFWKNRMLHSFGRLTSIILYFSLGLISTILIFIYGIS